MSCVLDSALAPVRQTLLGILTMNTLCVVEQELLYKEYLDISFPSQSLNKAQFNNLMKRLGFLDITEQLDKFFR